MDIKLTNKDLQNSGKKVVRVGYCGLQYFLRGVDKLGYNCGVYGWNWSAYDIGGGVIICTGYRNLTGENLPEGLETDFEERARSICNEYKWETERERLAALRAEFAARVTAEV